MVTNNCLNESTAASGTILLGQGIGTASAYSTAAYPSTAGTSGFVVTSNGTNFTSSSLPAGSRVLIQTQTASSSASIAFTSGFSGFSFHILEYFSVVLSTNNTNILITFSTNGGSSYSSTGYYAAGQQVSSDLSLNGAFTGQNFGNFAISNAASNSSTGTFNGSTYFFNLNSSTINKNHIHQGVAQYQGSTASDTVYMNGMWIGASVVNALKVAPGAGNFTSGTFRLLGVV